MEIPFLGKFGPKNQNCHFKVKFGTYTNSNMQNSMVMFIFFRFWVEIPFLGKIGPKNQNCHFKLKFGTYTNSNMQNSMVMFIFLVFAWKFFEFGPKNQNCPWNFTYTNSNMQNLVMFQNIKIVTLSWNLVRRLIRICRIQWWCSFFLFLIGNTLFGQIWTKKSKLSL